MDMTSDLRVFLASAEASATCTATRMQRVRRLLDHDASQVARSVLLRDALADAHRLVAYIEMARAEVERGY